MHSSIPHENSNRTSHILNTGELDDSACAAGNCNLFSKGAFAYKSLYTYKRMSKNVKNINNKTNLTYLHPYDQHEQ